MEKILSEEQLVTLQKHISEAKRVACVCHVNPDGDALGSTLALAEWMKLLGKECSVVVPNRFPDFLQWMPGADAIVRYDKRSDEAGSILRQADMLWICDMNSPSRVLGMEEILKECISQRNDTQYRVMVDHHLDPDKDFVHLSVSCPEMCATCEVLCHLICQLGQMEFLPHESAVCLYTGMMTDTGGFTYNSSRAVVYECIGQLLKKGIDKDRIYRNVFWTNSPNRMRLVGYLLYVKLEIIQGMNAAVMTLTNQERRTLGVKNGDTEGIVNMPLQIQGMRLSVLISEDTEHSGYVKFSLRSVDDFPCNEMSARFFGGGGHKNAAGGRLQCSIEDALAIFRKAITAYGKQLTE